MIIYDCENATSEPPNGLTNLLADQEVLPPIDNAEAQPIWAWITWISLIF
jgi:hypothetical protein